MLAADDCENAPVTLVRLGKSIEVRLSIVIAVVLPRNVKDGNEIHLHTLIPNIIPSLRPVIEGKYINGIGVTPPVPIRTEAHVSRRGRLTFCRTVKEISKEILPTIVLNRGECNATHVVDDCVA